MPQEAISGALPGPGWGFVTGGLGSESEFGLGFEHSVTPQEPTQLVSSGTKRLSEEEEQVRQTQFGCSLTG